MKERSSPEFYSEDANGKRSDHHLHEPILDGISDKHKRRLRRATRERAQKAHLLSDEALDRLYGED